MSVLEWEKLFHKSLCHSGREKQVIERNRRAKLNGVSEVTNRDNSALKRKTTHVFGKQPIETVLSTL